MVGERWAFIAVWIILLLLAFLYFSPEVGGITESLGNVLSIGRVLAVRREPDLIYIRVRVLRADMGISNSFMGNETDYRLKPLKGALVVIGNYPVISAGHLRIPQNYGFTGGDGTVILRAPKGNVTLMVAENPKYLKRSDFWKTEIKAERNRTYTVKIFLYRLKPVDIRVERKPFKLKTHLMMKFNLPRFGKYYVGYMLVSYYDIWFRPRLFREDMVSPISMNRTSNPYEMFRMRYSEVYEGGVSLNEILELNDPTTYAIPSMTYLPVERIVLEESAS